MKKGNRRKTTIITFLSWYSRFHNFFKNKIRQKLRPMEYFEDSVIADQDANCRVKVLTQLQDGLQLQILLTAFDQSSIFFLFPTHINFTIVCMHLMKSFVFTILEQNTKVFIDFIDFKHHLGLNRSTGYFQPTGLP